MRAITTSAELKNAILILEFEKELKRRLLEEQLLLLFESLKPVNMMKNVLSEVASSTYIIDNLIGSTVGLATGFITRKITVGTSGNVIKKILGSLLQFGVTNIVAHQGDTIKTIGKSIFQHFAHKKEMNNKNE